MTRPLPGAAASIAIVLAFTFAVGAVGAPATAQDRDWSKVEVKVIPVAGSVYMLQGAGGNIGLVVGDDGAFLVDDQFAPLSAKVKAAVASVTKKPVRFVFNTHWHGDHTGGNQALGEAGALIIAQDNVRTRLAAGQFNELFNRTVPPASGAALPVVTFSEDVTLHLDGEEIHAFHVPPAHTDGDAVVHFRHADVIHTGDLLFNGGFPVIDVPSGGSLSGMIAADDRVLAVAGPATKIIPGHGDLATVTDLRAFRDMLATVRERVLPLVKAGKSADEVIAAQPLADLDARWGKAFIKADSFLRAVHLSLSRELGLVPSVPALPAATPAPATRPPGASGG
jgi:cyclase